MLAVVSCADSETADKPVSAVAIGDEVFGYVQRIVDGDSLYLEGTEAQIRLWGVDAPEQQDPGYGEATKTLAAVAGERQLRCKVVDSDKYERFVGRCFRRDGKEVNRLMLESGTTREYCYFSGGHYGNCD